MCIYIREFYESEGKTLQDTLRKSKNRLALRRSQVILLSAQGMKAPEIAQTTYLHEAYVRELLRRFNREGLAMLKERPRSGRPKELTEEIKAEIAECALSPSRLLGLPFSVWSLEKLKEYLVKTKVIKSISIESLRTILKEKKVSLQRTKTWKESNDPAFQRKKNT